MTEPNNRWRVLTALVITVTVAAVLAVWHSRLSADFWPVDNSRIGPNLVASAVIASGLMILTVLLYPPWRRAVHRFVDAKLATTRSHAMEHERWMAKHLAEMYRKATGQEPEPHPHHGQL